MAGKPASVSGVYSFSGHSLPNFGNGYRYGLLVLLLHFMTSVSPEERKGIVTEYCQLESFSAQCGGDEVIIITSAEYGRMRLGRCVKKSYGSLGCSADVLPEVDRKCSGRQECEFPVADLHGRQPCPGDLTPFLEASYKCMKVTSPTNQGCVPGQGAVLSSRKGTIASIFSENTEYGSDICPWVVRGKPGQRINITLVNFARAPNPHESEDQNGFVEPYGSVPRICYQFAVIKEKGSRRSVTECEGGPKEVKAYTSSSHQVDITIISRKSTDTFFLLQYEVLGCANPPVPQGGHLRRVGDQLIIKCNFTDENWILSCNGYRWRGEYGNCSKVSDGSLFPSDGNFPYGILIVVAIGVALGVFFGGILLTLASLYMKRRRKDEGPPSGPADERIYNFNEADKRLGVGPSGQDPRLPQGTLPHGTGQDRIMMEAQVKDYLAEQQYQQYGYTDTGDSGYKGMSTGSSAHIYESPKFGRKFQNV